MEAGLLIAFLLATVIGIAVILPAAELANVWGLGSEAPQTIETSEEVKAEATKIESIKEEVEIPEEAEEVEEVVEELEQVDPIEPPEPEPEVEVETEIETQTDSAADEAPPESPEGDFPDFVPPVVDDAAVSE